MPYPELRGESRGVPQVAAGSFVFSLDVTLSPENLSCCLREGSQFFKLQGALRVSSQVTAWE